MNSDQHGQPDLNDFESRIRSLAPRPPLAATTPVEQLVETNQVADRRRWWSVDADAPYAFYRTVGLSASLGALFGVACTLLILHWNADADIGSTVQIAVSSDDVSPSSVSSSSIPPSRAAIIIENNQKPAVSSDSSSSLAYVELQPQFTNVRRNTSFDLPRDWLEELRRLKPGTLGVGTRLVSQQSARLRGTRKESTFELQESSRDESPEAATEISAGSPRIDLDSPPLPQRQWMQQMLNSPNKFY